MLKQTLTAVALTLVAGVAAAGETNPLHPSYAHFTAQANVQATGGNVEIAKNPLNPGYFQWNVAPVTGAATVEIAANNPLQPNYKRS